MWDYRDVKTLTIMLVGLMASSVPQPSLAQSASSPPASVQGFDATEIRVEQLPSCTVIGRGLAQGRVEIDLTTTSAQLIGSLTYVCNNAEGFTRRILSANGGSLRRGSGRIPYVLSHGGASPVALSPTPLTAPVTSHISPFGLIATGESGDVRVSVTASTSGLLAGAYEDTVTIEVSAD